MQENKTKKYLTIDIELKPCPCCGTKAWSRIKKSSEEKMIGYISCNNSSCGLGMEFEIKAKSVILSFDDVISGINDAVDRWNRRENNGQEHTTDR